ncbi:hypothetical protein CEP52_011864 [Fusarium oligoseptatum]|uniref:Uncharacterized protein n=1 Tax=Fusarium oligoseptatum TaxID=2604345 RepID=A0A428T1J4_9HYPO|nr:hypothetical protein CEP52_011864 [Fusarium oligoseptatum]
MLYVANFRSGHHQPPRPPLLEDPSPATQLYLCLQRLHVPLLLPSPSAYPNTPKFHKDILQGLLAQPRPVLSPFLHAIASALQHNLLGNQLDTSQSLLQKIHPKTSVVKKQPAPNKGMRMDDVKRTQQAAYAQGQKSGRKTGQAQGYKAGDKHGRKVGQEAGNREGFSKGQKQGYTQGHKSGHAEEAMLPVANKDTLRASAKDLVLDKRLATLQGTGKATIKAKADMSATTSASPLAITRNTNKGKMNSKGSTKTAVAGGAVAGAALGGTFMYLGHEALDPDGLSQVTEETETVVTEMEMSDDEFAPGEPVEEENWYRRYGVDEIPDQEDENYYRLHEGYLRYGDERFYEDGGYLGGGYDDSDGYDTNRDGGDDSQVHLGKEYEADRGGLSGGDDDIDEKGRGYESECDCDSCYNDCGDFWGCGNQDDKKGSGSSCVIM